MSRFMKRDPYMMRNPPMSAAGGMTMVSDVRSPYASEKPPARSPPKNPPIKKMKSGTMANACARMRYGATAPTVGPIETKAADVHALAMLMPAMRGHRDVKRRAMVMMTP